ncbi:MAG TPA: orotidine-5'-phosphate decarboxylase [Caldilineaceae bacterium]|nr:orotidine-5'-phosphate decarboxylase [Caldilineaceae bacterium]
MNFFARLEARVRTVDSLLCVGIDPRVQTVEALRAESFRLIDATVDLAAIYKPNIAFFEAFGPEGLSALKEVIQHVPDGVPVLLDAKRGDIADTVEAYAKAVFGELGADAVTASPYLGGDALRPLLADPQRGVFILCKTSNPGANEVQELPVVMDDEQAPLFAVIAQRAQQWNQQGNVGLVVGATDPQAMARVRATAPDFWILTPGIGPQGGQLEATVAAGLRGDGLGLLINASRQIASAADPRQAARELRDAINVARQAAMPANQQLPRLAFARLAHDLVATGCVRFGDFTLKSGLRSPIYMDLRRLVGYPAVLRRVAAAYAELLQTLPFDRLAGIPFAALPIATAISLEMQRPLVYPRPAKEYGTRASVEGEYAAGERIVDIDDVTTTGDSKFEAIQKLEEAGLQVEDIVVLIDRKQGAEALLAAAGYRLHTVLTLPALLDEWLRQGAITPLQHSEVSTFLAASPTPKTG